MEDKQGNAYAVGSVIYDEEKIDAVLLWCENEVYKLLIASSYTFIIAVYWIKSIKRE